MARNHEKQYGKLNRLILQKEKEDWAEKHPPRPKLGSLHTVDDIKKWLPSIKRDLEFNLKQSQVTCYSDAKITELHAEVVRLEREYKSFVRKIRQLDSSITSIPWTQRPYEKQKELTKTINGVYEVLDGPVFIPIVTPILDSEEQSVVPPVTVETVITTTDGTSENVESQEGNGDTSCIPISKETYSLPGEDEPLDFSTSFQTSLSTSNDKTQLEESSQSSLTDYKRHLAAIDSNTKKLYQVFGIEERNWSDDDEGPLSDLSGEKQINHVDNNCPNSEHMPNSDLKVHISDDVKSTLQHNSSQDLRTPDVCNNKCASSLPLFSGKRLLNLDYSSSDDD